MLIAMFPANVYAATHGLIAEWTDHLVPRTILQIVFLAAVAAVAHHYRPTATSGHAEPGHARSLHETADCAGGDT